MKLHETKIINNLNSFYDKDPESPIGLNIMRTPASMLMFWAVCSYFKPKRALEIGFFAGQTLGVILESGVPNITSVDIEYNEGFLSHFKHMYNNANIEFIEQDSRQVNYIGTYDFVHIDGDHSYEGVMADLHKVFKCTDSNSIIVLDDYNSDGVRRVIMEELIGQNDLVPFLVDDQAMFFHHISHNASDFLDNTLAGIYNRKISQYSVIVSFENRMHNSNTIESFMSDGTVCNTNAVNEPMFSVIHATAPKIFADSSNNLLINALKQVDL